MIEDKDRTPLRMKGLLPPVEVSRALLLAFVAAGALISIATQGQVSHFSAGFAAGAGAAFVVARLRRRPGEENTGAGAERT
jgi:hypothetical protein